MLRVRMEVTKIHLLKAGQSLQADEFTRRHSQRSSQPTYVEARQQSASIYVVVEKCRIVSSTDHFTRAIRNEFHRTADL